MKTFLLIFFLAPFLLFLSGCGKALYLSKLGWHQASITFQSVPIQDVLEDGQVSADAKEKIRLVQEVKRYGEERLGLKKTGSYSKYFEVKGPIVHVVTASEKDRLEPYCWAFPIVGKVTYKGFFTRADALEEKERLRERGYDTFVRRAGAYSTLGWLKDPILSSMLKWDEGALTNLILHEMAHGTVYFRKKTDLNEQMATFIGNQGAIGFLKERYGSGSKEMLQAVEAQEDDLLFSRWIDHACGRLSKFYAQPVSKDEIMKGREGIFLSLQEEFREMKSRFKTEMYQNFDQTPLNNAVLLAHRQYFHGFDTFERIHDYFQRDLSRVIALMKEIQASGEDPSVYLGQWMTEKGVIVSSSLQ
jgi:predicted aminopeptidase